jgi:1,4-alpha-glucan branching enzyme
MTSVTRDGVVEFNFFRPNVRSVSVVGDFNGWRTDALHMVTKGDGWWRAETRLQGGDYRFRYLADQEWFADYASHGVEYAQSGGGCDSLLVVPKTAKKSSRKKVRQVA